MTMLGIAELKRLAADPSPQARADMVAKLARDFDDDTFTATEIEIAHAIFRLLVKDTAVIVREALAAALRANPWVPRDIALTLVNDVEMVAVPFLAMSPAITQDDLLEVICRQKSPAKMRAIARRPLVLKPVVDALIEHGDDGVAKALAENPMAVFTDNAFGRLLDRFGGAEGINEALGLRIDLPTKILDRELTAVSDHVRDRLIAHHKDGDHRLMAMILATQERATLDLAGTFSPEGRAALISQLRHAGKLTPSLLLRSVCLGHLTFFEGAIAQLGDYLPAKLAILLREQSGIAAVCRRAGFSDRAIPIVGSALRAARELEAEGRNLPADVFSRRVVERVITECDSIGDGFDVRDLEFLLARAEQLART